MVQQKDPFRSSMDIMYIPPLCYRPPPERGLPQRKRGGGVLPLPPLEEHTNKLFVGHGAPFEIKDPFRAETDILISFGHAYGAVLLALGLDQGNPV